MSVRLHGDQRLVLVLRRQDDFVFTHLLDSVGEANDRYLATDAEPATRDHASWRENSAVTGEALTRPGGTSLVLPWSRGRVPP